MVKLNYVAYQTGYFCGGCNTIKLVMYKYKIVIPQQLQKYVEKFYHMYLRRPGLDQTEAMIRQHLYWTGIIESF